MKGNVTVLLLLTLASLSQAHQPPSLRLSDWLQWTQKYNKVYTTPAKEAKAYDAWLRHWHFVASHKARSDVTFTVELNQFADQEPREDRNSDTQSFSPLQYVPEMKTDFLPRAPPTSFDWRTKGVINTVRNQGAMGSSDAFAVTEDLESYHAINTGKLVTLSVTEVVDCCSTASGTLVADIYECIAQHGGLCSSASYPPHPGPHICRNNSCQAVAKDAKKTVLIPKGSEDQMVTAVLTVPLVVYVDASHSSFMLYQSGVYSDPKCGHRLDHAMQLVGYGVYQGIPYWILKNSWGAEWGQKGYMWMKRGTNMCGVADGVLYPQ